MRKLSIKHLVRFAGAKGRVVATLMIITTAALGFASDALAVAPINDDRAAATNVTIGDTDTIDTTEATIAFDDPVSNCGLHGHTVWYSFKPIVTTFIEADTFDSDYYTKMTAYVDDEGSLAQIACNDDPAGDVNQSRVQFEAQAGVTYLFMVGAAGDIGPGGNLTFNLDEASPPVQIELAINSRGAFSPRTGSATPE